MDPQQQVIADVVRIIVEAVHPRRIILFGSAARGQSHADSDLDVLVVMPDGTHRRETARTIRKRLLDIPQFVDVVVATEEDLLKYGDNFSLVYYPALREGRVLYAA